MNLLIFVLARRLLLLDQLAALEISRGDDGLATNAVLAANDRQLEVVRLVHLGVFGPFADGRSRQSFLVSTLVRQKKEE